MSKDRLSEATQALREADEASEFESRSTRARVLIGLHQSRVHRRTRLVFLLPIAASFVAASAWGASNGNAHVVWETIANWVSPSRAKVHHIPTLSAPVPAPAPVPVPVPVPAGTTPNAPAPSQVPSSSFSRAITRAAEPNDPRLALYRVAHTAHFVDHDPARALAAWDAYLVAAPSGAFAPEARYNRALSLVRLGRNGEARAALQPFANGTYGGYRESEARALLERLIE